MEGRIRGNLKNICEVCGQNRTEFSSAKSFWNHTCHKNIVKCVECGKEYANKVSLKVHVHTIHLKITHNCNTCHKSFKSKANLSQHMKTHTDSKPFECVNCKKEFSRKEKMKKHFYSCNKVITNIHKGNNQLLQPGIKLREEGINLKFKLLESQLETCDICQKSFDSRAHLNAHAKMHQVKVEFKSNICHKA